MRVENLATVLDVPAGLRCRRRRRLVRPPVHVCRPADEDRPHRPGQLLPRRRLGPSLRHLVEAAAEQPSGEAAVGAHPVEHVEVDDPGERDDPAEAEARPCRRPEREVAARGVPDGRDAAEVEGIRARQLGHVVERVENVL